MARTHAGGGRRWQFWIDRGGTFTDIVARVPDGSLITHKLLSEDPEHYPDAAIEGIRRLMNLDGDKPIPADAIDAIKMGTTVATNALLERAGEPTVLFITKGFRDALRIGYQNRPRLFDRHIVLSELLYSQVFEVDERLDAHGHVMKALDIEQVTAQLECAYAQGFQSLAVTLMHAWRYPAHEQEIERLARRIGFNQVSVSHKTSPLIKLISRGDTTVVDAYLSPVLRRYVNQVAEHLSESNLYCLRSSGGLTRARAFQGKDAILSGPAGGIIGMVRTAKAAGFRKVIGFDMGGTSTDVSHFAGELEREFETHVAGVRLRAPMMSIHTIAAGGGSVLHFSDGRFRVGPDSAGASPGPAAYRRGGPLTLTDCNVLLGKIQPAHFPKVFGMSGKEALDVVIVREKFTRLANEIASTKGSAPATEAIAEGFIDIAVRNMANAISRISVARGYNVTEYVLNTFGGAGGQHACLVADHLGITRVFLHPLAGVLSAYGIGLADLTAMRERTAELEVGESALPQLQRSLDDLAQEARAELLAQGVPEGQIRIVKTVHLRYRGTDTALPIAFGPLAQMIEHFETAYLQRFSFLIAGRSVIAGTLVAEAIGEAGQPVAEAPKLTRARQEPPVPAEIVRIYSGGQWYETPLYRREALRSYDVIRGPAVIAETNSTTIVEGGWIAQVTALNSLFLERIEPPARRSAAGTRADPVLLEIFNNLFMSIAEQMGLRLQQTAQSVNIKERLDFSCAVFDREGNLIANAPHIPVHLGSMGDTIKTVIRENAGRIRPGDSFAVNDPYQGGTHLPDITVVTPVFDHDRKSILFYVGSRGHHSDIGGITPGSMPPDSTSVEQEGVLFTNWKLVDGGAFRETETRAQLTSGRYPARNPAQNLADLRAQIAANAKGQEELSRMVEEFGQEVVTAYTRHVQDNAEEAVRQVVGSLKDGEFSLRTDNGAVIKVAIRIDHSRRAAVIDFTGTSSALPNNFNAPSSISTAAVLFVFRSLVNRDIPLNAGCLKPLEIVIPEGSMLNPRYPAAVVAGNVETSQCIANALFGALGVCAASQCTMNSFSFGNDAHQYIETIAGGSGAGQGYDGTDVVQTNMTNSLITDPEVLELRYPVLLEAFEIRQGSGGGGRWHGGQGAKRRMRFLAPMTASILSNNRRVAPYGLSGGLPGGLGCNRVERADGRTENVGSCATTELAAGDVFIIETPGGGGYGAP